MKTLIQTIVGTLALVAIFTAAAKAQEASSLEQVNSAQQISWSQVPRFGTFWVEGPNGFALPYPSPPVYLSDAPIYALDNGQFLVDARNSKNFNQPVAAAQSMAAVQQFSPLAPSPMDKPCWYRQTRGSIR